MTSDHAHAGSGMEPDEFCRSIEAYICRKNDGHLIRISGPAFDLVRGWAELGMPLKVAYAGIDRTFERYYRKGPRRRPVHVTFCEADVLDVFEEWQRALGLPQRLDRGEANGAAGERHGAAGLQPGRSEREPEYGAADLQPGRSERDGATDRREGEAGYGAAGLQPGRPRAARARPAASLPSHLERVLSRLTVLRGSDRRRGPAWDEVLADAVRAIDALTGRARQARGDARSAIVAELERLDRMLLDAARDALDVTERTESAREAEAQLAPFRERMSPEAHAAAVAAASDALLRQAAGLPTIAYGGE